MITIILLILCYYLTLCYAITVTVTADCGANNDSEHQYSSEFSPSPTPPPSLHTTSSYSYNYPSSLDTEGAVSYYVGRGSCIFTIYNGEKPYVQALIQCPANIETVPTGCTNIGFKTYCPPISHCSWVYPNKNSWYRQLECNTDVCTLTHLDNGIPSYACTPSEGNHAPVTTGTPCVISMITTTIITSRITQYLTYYGNCPSTRLAPGECTSYAGSEYCPLPSCLPNNSTLSHGHNGNTTHHNQTICGTFSCSFVTESGFTGFNCDPSTTTSSDGCYTTEFREWGSRYFSSGCLTTTTNCNETIFTHDKKPYTYTTCGAEVTSVTGCNFTGNDFFPGLFLTCNEPCTETFLTESPLHSLTLTFEHCPGPYITPPPIFFTSDPHDCTSYKHSLYCPYFCTRTVTYQEYYGTLMLVTQTFCDTKSTCSFYTTDEKPSFVCINLSDYWYESTGTTYWPEQNSTTL